MVDYGADCKKQLPANWHVDHIFPFVLGGPTDILNGRPLCPQCNHKKGATMSTEIEQIFQLAWGFPPRAFQEECLRQFVKARDRHKTAVIAPAAGKTMLGSAYAAIGLKAKWWKNIVAVGPTTEIVTGWVKDTSAVGINLSSNFSKDVDAKWDSNYHGVAVTYMSLMHNPGWFKRRFGYSTLAVFDEGQHLMDENPWENSRTIFSSTEHVLRLS